MSVAPRADYRYSAGRKLTNKLLIGDFCRVKLDSHTLSVSCGSSTDVSIFGVACLLAAIAVANGGLEVRKVLQEYVFRACER